jgi:hypothetical protein
MKKPRGPTVITKLYTTGSPHGDAEVDVVQTARNTATLTCLTCQAQTTVALPGGRVDVVGMAALDDGVERLHRGDA